MRLDIYLVNKQYCESRNKAASLIADGNISVNSRIIRKPSYDVKESDIVKIKDDIKVYVARSAKKLLTAYERFSLSFNGKTAVDLGASTGGFCQVMLDNGIKKIYAVDIGSNQLHDSIRSDKRVISMENTNARNITPAMFNDVIDIITCDLSFISLAHILPAVYDTLKPMGEFICLVKPQFEVGPSNIGKNGVVKSLKLRKSAVCKVTDLAYTLGFEVRDVCFSELEGESGNREYLVYMRKNRAEKPFSHEIIENRINEI